MQSESSRRSVRDNYFLSMSSNSFEGMSRALYLPMKLFFPGLWVNIGFNNSISVYDGECLNVPFGPTGSFEFIQVLPGFFKHIFEYDFVDGPFVIIVHLLDQSIKQRCRSYSCAQPVYEDWYSGIFVIFFVRTVIIHFFGHCLWYIFNCMCTWIKKRHGPQFFWGANDFGESAIGFDSLLELINERFLFFNPIRVLNGCFFNSSGLHGILVSKCARLYIGSNRC